MRPILTRTRYVDTSSSGRAGARGDGDGHQLADIRADIEPSRLANLRIVDLTHKRVLGEALLDLGNEQDKVFKLPETDSKLPICLVDSLLIYFNRTRYIRTSCTWVSTDGMHFSYEHRP